MFKEQDDDSEQSSEWDPVSTFPLHVGDKVTAKAMGYDAEKNEVCVAVQESSVFGVVVALRNQIQKDDEVHELTGIGFRGDYPLLEGPDGMELSYDPVDSHPTENSQDLNQDRCPGTSNDQRPSYGRFPPTHGEKSSQRPYRERFDTRHPCRHYARGWCNYGRRCNFRHDRVPGQPGPPRAFLG